MPICDCSAYINVKSHLNTYYITNYKLSFFFLQYILILLNNYDKLNIKNYKKLKPVFRSSHHESLEVYKVVI